MSSIFITGGSSFIGQTIVPELSSNHSIFSPNHRQLDIKNQLDLYELFKESKFDVIIHTACQGGRRNHKDNPQDFYDNLLMLNNLLYFQDIYKFKLILMSSGAEYDRRGNIFNVKENQFTPVPIDYYGLSKYTQTQLIKNKNNIINLRLFNVFSEIGMKNSFIYQTIKNCLLDKDINIWEDKIFSFFYGKDLVKIIDYIILKDSSYFELNCVYQSLYKLSEIANLIKKLTNSQSKIIIDKSIGKSYHGEGKKLYSLNLKLNGLVSGITNCINYQNENKY